MTTLQQGLKNYFLFFSFLWYVSPGLCLQATSVCKSLELPLRLDGSQRQSNLRGHTLLLTPWPGYPAILSVQGEHMGPSRSFSNQKEEIPSSRTTPFAVDEQGTCTSTPSPNSSPLQGLLQRDHQGSPTTFHSGSCLN